MTNEGSRRWREAPDWQTEPRWHELPPWRDAPLWREVAVALLIGTTLVLAALQLIQLWPVNQAGLLLDRQRITRSPAQLQRATGLLEAEAARPGTRSTSFWRTYGAAAARRPTEQAFRRLDAAQKQGLLDRTGELWLGEVAAATGHWEEAHGAYARVDATNLLVDRGDKALKAGDRASAHNWYVVAATSVLAAIDREAAQAGSPTTATAGSAGGDPLRAPGQRAIALLRIGNGLLTLGKPDEAVPLLERAVSAMHADPPGIREQQSIQLALARSLTLAYGQPAEPTTPGRPTPDPSRTLPESIDQRVHVLVDRALAKGATAQTYYEAGKISDLAGDHDGAITLLREAISRDPKLTDAYLALGRILDQHGLVLTARDLYRDGAGRLPNNAALASAYAIAEFRLEPPEVALPLLNRASRLAGADPFVFVYLGDAYRALGQSELARQAYERGLRRYPDYPALTSRLRGFTHPGGFLR